MSQENDIYLYLGRRDKNGIRLLSKFLGRKQLPIRIDDVNSLQLPVIWQTQLNQIIFEQRMLWEPWLESADSYDELRAMLKVRGYTNIPINAQLELNFANLQTPSINVSHLIQRTTMLRKA